MGMTKRSPHALVLDSETKDDLDAGRLLITENQRMKGKRIWIFASVIAVCACCSIAGATTVYREDFDYCADPLPQFFRSYALVDWDAMVSGLRPGRIGYLKISQRVTPDQLPSIGSNPRGPNNGSLFWSKLVPGLLMFTQEAPLPVEEFDQVTYQQRLFAAPVAQPDGSFITQGDSSRLALLIEGTWYISDTAVSQKDWGEWESVSFSPKQITWGTTPFVADQGPFAPTNSGVALPATGTVTAFGVFVTSVNGRARIDDFTISNASPAPDPASDIYPACSSVTIAPDDPDQAVQTPTPAPNATPNGNNTVNNDTNTHNTAYQFCGETSGTSRAGSVKVPKGGATRVLARLKARNLKAKRDRLLVQLVLQQKIKPEGLVDIRTSDITMRGKRTVLKTSGAARRNVILRSSTAAALRGLMKAEKVENDPNAPVFLDFTGKNTSAPNDKVLCSSSIRKLVLAYAKRAHVRVTI